MIIEGRYRVKRPRRLARFRARLASEAHAAAVGWQLILTDLAGALLGLATNHRGVMI